MPTPKKFDTKLPKPSKEEKEELRKRVREQLLGEEPKEKDD